MSPTIKIFVTIDGLYLQFASRNTQNLFLKQMQENGIDIIINENSEVTSYFKNYQHTSPTGQFISQQNLIGLAFHSEKHKFIFIETIGLKAKHFMDLGPGYESQLHFNPDYLSNIPGESLAITPVLT